MKENLQEKIERRRKHEIIFNLIRDNPSITTQEIETELEKHKYKQKEIKAIGKESEDTAEERIKSYPWVKSVRRTEPFSPEDRGEGDLFVKFDYVGLSKKLERPPVIKSVHVEVKSSMKDVNRYRATLGRTPQKINTILARRQRVVINARCSNAMFKKVFTTQVDRIDRLQKHRKKS